MKIGNRSLHARCAIAHLPKTLWENLEAGDELVIYPSDSEYSLSLGELTATYFAVLLAKQIKLEPLQTPDKTRVWRLVNMTADPISESIA